MAHQAVPYPSGLQQSDGLLHMGADRLEARIHSVGLGRWFIGFGGYTREQ